MAIKKSQIYSSLWQSCDKLRGGMDASQYKDYILVLLFVKYVSDRYAGDPNAVIVVPEGGSFADMVKLRGDKEIGDKINKIIAKLAEANGLKGVIDVANFNDPDKLGDGKEMIDRLSDLIALAPVEAKEAAAEELRRSIEELDEEQGGEDGLLFEGKNEKSKLTAASLKARLKEIKSDKEAAEERQALEKCLQLIEEEAQASKAAKDARIAR